MKKVYVAPQVSTSGESVLEGVFAYRGGYCRGMHFNFFNTAPTGKQCDLDNNGTIDCKSMQCSKDKHPGCPKFSGTGTSINGNGSTM